MKSPISAFFKRLKDRISICLKVLKGVDYIFVHVKPPVNQRGVLQNSATVVSEGLSHEAALLYLQAMSLHTAKTRVISGMTYKLSEVITIFGGLTIVNAGNDYGAPRYSMKKNKLFVDSKTYLLLSGKKSISHRINVRIFP